MIRLLDKPPEGAGSDRGRSDRNISNRGRPDFKRSGEGRSRDFKKGDFKGKGKSDRWRSSDRKKPKFSPFADNYIEKDVSEYMKHDNLEITIEINNGNKSFTCYTMDLTQKYISINSDYRS